MITTFIPREREYLPRKKNGERIRWWSGRKSFDFSCPLPSFHIDIIIWIAEKKSIYLSNFLERFWKHGSARSLLLLILHPQYWHISCCCSARRIAPRGGKKKGAAVQRLWKYWQNRENVVLNDTPCVYSMKKTKMKRPRKEKQNEKARGRDE